MCLLHSATSSYRCGYSDGSPPLISIRRAPRSAASRIASRHSWISRCGRLVRRLRRPRRRLQYGHAHGHAESGLIVRLRNLRFICHASSKVAWDCGQPKVRLQPTTHRLSSGCRAHRGSSAFSMVVGPPRRAPRDSHFSHPSCHQPPCGSQCKERSARCAGISLPQGDREELEDLRDFVRACLPKVCRLGPRGKLIRCGRPTQGALRVEDRGSSRRHLTADQEVRYNTRLVRCRGVAEGMIWRARRVLVSA